MFSAWINRLTRTLISVLIVTALTWAIFGLHAKAFAAGFIYLLPIMIIAFRWGLLEASIASVLAVCYLDYFFTQPLFHLYMSDPQDWIALTCFEAIVLLVSRFATRLKKHTTEADYRREQVEKLYLLSHDILLLERKDVIGLDLAKLIKEVFQLDGVSIWDAKEASMSNAGPACISVDEVRGTPLHEHRRDDIAHKTFQRELLIGTRSVGAIGLAGRRSDTSLDSETADAIASLAALTLEHAYSFKAESDARAAKQTEQLRTAVLDGLAHAFKTPLATIQAASSGLLEMKVLESVQEELVSVINQEAIHLERLTTQALQTATIDREHLKLHKKKIDIQQLWRDLSVKSDDLLHGHPLHVCSEDDPDVEAWADDRLLKMALLELLDNALKYANPGAAITIRAVTTETEIVFSVMNEGSYIEPDERIRIFRRFYRSPGSRYRASGTGIGLSFVKRIAEAHLGRVWVKSEPDIGTTFFFTLPRGHKEA